MRILQIGGYSFFDYRGGIERIIYKLSKELSHRGHAVTLIAATREKKRFLRINENFLIIFLKGFELFNTPLNFSLAKYISDYDLVHLHFPNPGNVFIAALFAKFLKIPYIFTYHTPIVSYNFIKILYNSLVLNFLLKNSAKITIPSPNCIDYFPNLSYFQYKIKLIPNFIDPSLFHLKKNAKENLLNYFNSSNSFILTFISTLDKAHEFKGLSVLLSAIKILSETEPNQKFQLIVVGDGSEKGKYIELCKELRISEKVLFIGRVPDKILPLIYSASNCVILPSVKTESFGLVLAEAMACKCPVIGTNIGGIPSTIADAGFLVQPNKPDELAEKIHLLMHNNELQTKLGLKGYERVNNHFTIHKIVKIYEDLYIETVGARK